MRDCKQLNLSGEAHSRRALRGMGQNHIPDGWPESGTRGCDRGLPSCEVGPSGASTGITSLRLAPGGSPPRVSTCGVPCNGSGSVSIGHSEWFRGARAVGPCGGARTDGGCSDASWAAPSSPGYAVGVRAPGAPSASGTPTVVCGSGMEHVLGAPSAGPGAVRVCVVAVAGRAGSGWKSITTCGSEACGGGPVRKGEARSQSWGQTAAQPDSCPTSRVCSPGARRMCVYAPS